jgi:uncharacterized membrane protein
MTLFLAFLIGFFVGLRSLAPPAVTAWAAHLGWLKLQGPLAFMGSIWSVALFTVLMLGELAADKWAKIPNRISPPPLIARVLTGGLTGACIAVAGGESLLLGAALGGCGGIAGAFAGYQARKRLVQALKTPDFPIAVLEDLVTLGGCLWIVTRFG